MFAALSTVADVCETGVCPAPAPAKADAFLPSGRIALGANYWASHAATEMWRKWDAKVVDEDLRVLAANGMKLLRVFPNWADFQPIHACYLSSCNFDKINETRMFDSEEPLPDTPWFPAIPRKSSRIVARLSIWTLPRNTASALSCRF